MSVARRAAMAATLAGGLALRPEAPRLESAPPPADAACPAKDVFRDDFGRFPPGWLSHPVGQPVLNGAIQEYHYLPHRGVPLGAWENSICYLDAWVAGDEDGTPVSGAAPRQPAVGALRAALRDRRSACGATTRWRPRCGRSLSTTSRAWPSATRRTATTTSSRSAAGRRRVSPSASPWRRPSASPSGASSAAPPSRTTRRRTTRCASRTRARASAPTSTAPSSSRPATPRS